MSGRAVKEELKYTYHDYCLFPEDKRYEVIDGDAYHILTPPIQHQAISQKLVVLIFYFLRKVHVGELLFAPVDVVLTDYDIVQPDILYISNERKSILTEANVQGAPDWVIEILSPSSIERDRDLKLKLYSRHAVKEYWIVDPGQLSVDVFCLENEALQLKQTAVDGSVECRLMSALQITVKDVSENIQP